MPEVEVKGVNNGVTVTAQRTTSKQHRGPIQTNRRGNRWQTSRVPHTRMIGTADASVKKTLSYLITKQEPFGVFDWSTSSKPQIVSLPLQDIKMHVTRQTRVPTRDCGPEATRPKLKRLHGCERWGKEEPGHECDRQPSCCKARGNLETNEPFGQDASFGRPHVDGCQRNRMV